MSIVTITPRANRPAPIAKSIEGRDCGPEGCEVDWLASRRHQTDSDARPFPNMRWRKAGATACR